MKFNMTRRQSVKALAAGTVAFALSAGMTFADNADVKIGFTPKFLKDDFQTLMLDLSKKAFDAKGFTLVGAPDPNGDIAAQVDALTNLMANGANVIVFAPLDAAGIVPVVEKANESGVLVFSIDDSPAGGKVTATVRADNVDAGAQGAKEMAKRLEAAPCWKDDSCIVLELQGALTTPNGLDRSEGFAKTLAELAPKVQIIQRPTEWTADMAADAAQNVLTQNPNLAGIFMASELMATAVNAQLNAAGKGAAVGEEGNVIRIAIDGTPQGLQLIRDKALDATVSQPLSAYATKTAELIELVKGGGTIELGKRDDGQVIDTPVGPQYQLNATLVTAENVDSPDLWANQVGK
ncbi:sugar ABC transporter substrate-binding protein [Paragemmobacter straminiformis]|uniref:Sugar ABC transporter substrate-binding protein n=1 Tax=Paragemmobacter straminiformis TaxID=2045119 RepID=A0A842I9M7_9RHOB|nr:sugar ABC transporter substrate-binding protein [Gemmobacter straminiformis]MBC2836550.1 sugar ABC transporter substrate-binding protein [Gemmobacter straminiformis]